MLSSAKDKAMNENERKMFAIVGREKSIHWCFCNHSLASQKDLSLHQCAT